MKTRAGRRGASRRSALAAAGCAALAFACAATVVAQPPPPPGGAAGRTQAPGRFEFMNYTAPVPKAWEPLPTSSSFRAAQYRVPAARGAGDAEAVVFYFGPGQGGPVAANVERWRSQFTGDDGRPVKPAMQTLRAGGLPATVVELTGRYARAVGGMGQGVAARPDQTLLAAVIETPQGNLTLQLHGDRATVAQHRAGFLAMVEGFKPTR